MNSARSCSSLVSFGTSAASTEPGPKTHARAIAASTLRDRDMTILLENPLRLRRRGQQRGRLWRDAGPRELLSIAGVSGACPSGICAIGAHALGQSATRLAVA